MTASIREFLHSRGFHSNPFVTSSAEREIEHQASYFMKPLWFGGLVGDSASPETSVLFAPRGAGKTSARFAVERCVSARSLVVHFADFNPLIGASQKPPISAYISHIVPLVLKRLDQQLRDSHQFENALKNDGNSYTLFCTLLKLFAPQRYYLRGEGSNDGLYHAFSNDHLTTSDWLDTLASLVKAAGFMCIYVLVDGVDELAETNANMRAAASLLSPLLSAPGLLEHPGFAFKFFLPLEIDQVIRDQPLSRLDRITSYRLEWTDEQLTKMLAKRLSIHTANTVCYFGDLCGVNDCDIDKWLAAMAQGSPRRLINLARQIIEEHCRIAPDAITPISFETISQEIKRMSSGSTECGSLDIQEWTVSPQRAGVEEQPLLYLDERGDVWLGDKKLTAKLTKMMRLCLEILWQQRNQFVKYEDLQRALYTKDLDKRSDAKASSEKLIHRLREALEPGRKSSNTYIETRVGIGYVLRNFRDDANHGH